MLRIINSNWTIEKLSTFATHVSMYTLSFKFESISEEEDEEFSDDDFYYDPAENVVEYNGDFAGMKCG